MLLLVRVCFILGLLQMVVSNSGVYAQAANGAFIPGDFADPSITSTNSSYYAVGTSSEWAPHFPIFASKDLLHWQQAGYVFDKAPVWTSGSFWAPEYYQLNGTYYVYYTARRKSDGHSYIGVATSSYPDHGFEDHGVLLAFGTESIDPFIYNDNGQLYMSFKAYGLDDRPIELLGIKLSADGLKTEGETFSLLKDDNREGMEGQSILKRGAYYYLFYSAGNCCGSGCSYNVRVARASSFKGPYEKYSGNPVLSGNDVWHCTGHGTFVNAPGGKTYYLHHAYNKSSNVYTGRQGLLAELSWRTDDWPSLTELPAASGSADNITDSFLAAKPAKYWQWDFRHATPAVTQGHGKLTLSGNTSVNNNAGLALTVRPVTDHFEVTTAIVNQNEDLKGLVFYGDADAAVGVGVENNIVKFWKIKKDNFLVIASQTVKPGTVELKLLTLPGATCRAYYRAGTKEWTPLGGEADAVDISFLPQWDRSPRAGLHIKGKAGSKAVFSVFALKYL